MSTLLLVDDDPLQRQTLAQLLRGDSIRVLQAGDVAEARALLAAQRVHLVLSDMNMPGGSGLELVRHVSNNHEDTAVVMITGVDDPDVAALAIESGAYGYLLKPAQATVVQIAVHNALRRRELEIENRSHRRFLERMVAERTAELRLTIEKLEAASDELASSQEETIQRLSRAAEFRSDETALHIKRMSLFCEHLARLDGADDAWAERLRIASPMHDIGKIATPDAVLGKPGKLTADEYEVMKQHAEIGYRILAGSTSEMLQLAAEVARTHHERWDGAGYPRGLKGEEIPISGRIVAIADVFDALTSRRCYKPAFTVEKTREIMQEGRGGHFDPRLLDLFWSHIDAFLAIRAKHLDRDGKGEERVTRPRRRPSGPMPGLRGARRGSGERAAGS